MIKILIANGKDTVNITQMVRMVTWSGDYLQCSRTLNFEIISSYTDKNIPNVACDLGYFITFMYGSEVLFKGYIFERQKGTESNVLNITCYDSGIYLKRNETSKKYVGITPEAITKAICKEFEIDTGDIIETNIAISRNFIGTSLYNIIQTAYTLASDETGKNYMIRFEGLKLTVVEKKKDDKTIIIAGGSNLMSAVVTESISNMINKVEIYNAENVLIKTEQDADAIKQYGTMQAYLKQMEGENVTKKAKKILKDNSISQNITVNNLGNIKNIAGGTVVVKEQYTGIFGLFYIDADVHTWKNGQYYNKLTLNFKNIMDEKEAGSLPNKDGSKSR